MTYQKLKTNCIPLLRAIVALRLAVSSSKAEALNNLPHIFLDFFREYAVDGVAADGD